jgi:hypothetical protein
MGMTTCMKTVEVTRSQEVAKGGRVPGTMQVFLNILRTQGIRGVNKGVNAVALRQITGWSSRMGIARAAEGPIRKLKGKNKTDSLTIGEKITASTIGGALSCWNQPFEVSLVFHCYCLFYAISNVPSTGYPCGHASCEKDGSCIKTYNDLYSEANLA